MGPLDLLMRETKRTTAVWDATPLGLLYPVSAVCLRKLWVQFSMIFSRLLHRQLPLLSLAAPLWS